MKHRLCMVFLLALTFLASAEDLAQKERSFIELLRSRSQKATELSGIEARLSELADKIDSAKKTAPRNEDLIRKLMASGIPVSDSLAMGKTDIKELDRRIANMQNNLVRLYKAQIDSLSDLLKNSSSDERSALNVRFELISQKYMLLNPAIRQLSFNPAKLQEIELSNIGDPVEQDILSAFLKKSLLEVEERIDHIQSDLQEIEPFVKLNEKTREFLEEVDGDNFILLGNTEPSTAALDEFQSDQFPSVGLLSATFIEQNAFSIEQLMDQLEISDFTLENTVDNDGNFLQPRFSSGDYVKLLREIEDQLKSVRSKIRDRLQEVTP